MNFKIERMLCRLMQQVLLAFALALVVVAVVLLLALWERRTVVGEEDCCGRGGLLRERRTVVGEENCTQKTKKEVLGGKWVSFSASTRTRPPLFYLRNISPPSL